MKKLKTEEEERMKMIEVKEKLHALRQRRDGLTVVINRHQRWLVREYEKLQKRQVVHTT